MIKKSFIVKDQDGLHARPASLLSGLASRFSCTTDIEYKGKQTTLKSIMIVMSLGVAFNSEFSIITDGDQEQEAFDAIENLLLDHHII